MVGEVLIGHGDFKLPRGHGFILAGDPSIGELFIKCLCDWQETHWITPNANQEVGALVERSIREHNASPGGVLANE